MCILAFSVHESAIFPFVCLHNRDEETGRPTTELTREGGIICAKDLRAGGTWMGLNEHHGHFTALTNYRNKYISVPTRSRGLLVQRFLQRPPELRRGKCFLGHEFPGFNLIYADLFTPPTCPSFGAVFLTNAVRAESKQPQDVRFSASFAAGHFIHSDTHCFGNGHLNDMSWVKVRWLREEVRRVVRSQDSQRSPPTTLEEEIEAANALVGQLFPLMARQEPFPLELLNPDLSWSTEPLEHEQAMQRHVFMPHDLKGADGRPVDFATRAMTVVIRTRSAVLYYYRNTDHFPDMRPWQCEVVQVPAMVEAGRVRKRVLAAAAVLGLATAALSWLRR